MPADGANTTLFGNEAIELDPLAIPLSSGPDRIARSDDAAELLAFSLAGTSKANKIIERLCAGVYSARRSADLRAFHPSSKRDQPRQLLLCERPQLESMWPFSHAARLLLRAQEALEVPPIPPAMMGILNVTPDSFSDGGQFLAPERALEQGLRMAAEGADWIDIGGESTRPGSDPVPEQEELRRVVPVVEALAARWNGRISIDTRRSEVARAALAAGASMVNDVSAGRDDPKMLPLVAQEGCELCLMHMRGTPATMQEDPRYEDVVGTVSGFLRDRVRACLIAGIELPKIILDPGIGFGKRLEHNLELLRRLPELRSLSRPLLLGVSRKSFIAHVTGEKGPLHQGAERPAAGSRVHDESQNPRLERLGGTAAAVAQCVRGGASILRVHEVGVMAEAARRRTRSQRRDQSRAALGQQAATCRWNGTRPTLPPGRDPDDELDPPSTDPQCRGLPRLGLLAHQPRDGPGAWPGRSRPWSASWACTSWPRRSS